jgi:hypothetical protein
MVGLLWMSDQPVTEASIYTIQHKHKRQTSVPSVGFEPAIPATKLPQTYALDRAATGICLKSLASATDQTAVTWSCSLSPDSILT